MLAPAIKFLATNAEEVTALAVVAIALIAPRLGARSFDRLEALLAPLAQRRWLAILIAGITPLLLRATLLPFSNTPEPRVHDEFSYLLAADTFGRGRLTNPQHPMWVHFETIHVLWRPTYASIFPVCQGLALALGRVITGHPWGGVWLSVAAMCAAICWMLQGWTSPGWALLGAMLAAVRLGVIGYWMNSYWGGAVAATGGALLFGALPRIMLCAGKRWQCWRSALVMALGIAILANSRSYEGLILSVPAALFLLLWMMGKDGPPTSVTIRNILLPMLLVLAITAVSMGYYFARVTGSPFLIPYVLYRNTASMAPHFLWQQPRPEPVYRHYQIRKFFLSEIYEYHHARRFSALVDKAQSYWRFFLGPLLTIPLIAFPWRSRDRGMRFLLWTALLFSLGSAVEVWHNLHYAASGNVALFRPHRAWSQAAARMAMARQSERSVSGACPAARNVPRTRCAGWRWRGAVWLGVAGPWQPRPRAYSEESD